MSQSIESRAIDACRELYLANQAVTAISKEIGYCLLACNEDWDAKHGPSPFDVQMGRAGKPWISHLERAYASEKDERGVREWLEPDEIEEILAECPHCLRAHQLIQDRKGLRQKLGIAKRRVTLIGRSA